MARSKSIALAKRRVLWRVVAPAAGNDEGDSTLIETPSEAVARDYYDRLRSSRWPVRLEQARCGPTQLRQSPTARSFAAASASPPS
jgi:hypothetical protein